jgi:DNA-binding response OmpR family regulator
MNVLIFGNPLLVGRFKIALAVDEVKVYTPHENVADTLDNIIAKRYNLVIIDSRYPDALKLCDIVFSLDCIPVDLVISEKTADWSALCEVNVDGFLTREASDAELRTRINATCRRDQLVRDSI